jgi:hypothetical protein
MDPQRELRQQVDDLFRSDKTRKFTVEEIAGVLRVGPTALSETLDSVARCPRAACQSYDTVLVERVDESFEVHHCNRCNKDFHAQREPDGDYSYVGMYLD